MTTNKRPHFKVEADPMTTDADLPALPCPNLSNGGHSDEQIKAYARAAVRAAIAADRERAGSVDARVVEDAERYRLLRRGQHWSVIDGVGDTLRAEQLDAAIDAARSKP